MKEKTKFDTASNTIDIRLFGEKESMEKRQYKELRMPLDDDDKLATEVTIDGNKILPPNGYLVGKITQVDNGMLVEYVKKRPQYPTTYEQCYDEDNTDLHFIYVDKDERDLYESFIKLIRCRNTYWKIAGDEMGLGKPWEPDWGDFVKVKYVLLNYNGKFSKMTTLGTNCILAFPTEEICDNFYKNFKDLIKKCKELL